MIAVKAAVRGTFQALCLTRPYIAPLQFDEVRNKIAMEDQLFDEFGSRRYFACGVLFASSRVGFHSLTTLLLPCCHQPSCRVRVP